MKKQDSVENQKYELPVEVKCKENGEKFIFQMKIESEESLRIIIKNGEDNEEMNSKTYSNTYSLSFLRNENSYLEFFDEIKDFEEHFFKMVQTYQQYELSVSEDKAEMKIGIGVDQKDNFYSFLLPPEIQSSNKRLNTISKEFSKLYKRINEQENKIIALEKNEEQRKKLIQENKDLSAKNSELNAQLIKVTENLSKSNERFKALSKEIKPQKKDQEASSVDKKIEKPYEIYSDSFSYFGFEDMIRKEELYKKLEEKLEEYLKKNSEESFLEAKESKIFNQELYENQSSIEELFQDFKEESGETNKEKFQVISEVSEKLSSTLKSSSKELNEKLLEIKNLINEKLEDDPQIVLKGSLDQLSASIGKMTERLKEVETQIEGVKNNGISLGLMKDDFLNSLDTYNSIIKDNFAASQKETLKKVEKIAPKLQEINADSPSEALAALSEKVQKMKDEQEAKNTKEDIESISETLNATENTLKEIEKNIMDKGESCKKTLDKISNIIKTKKERYEKRKKKKVQFESIWRAVRIFQKTVSPPFMVRTEGENPEFFSEFALIKVTGEIRKIFKSAKTITLQRLFYCTKKEDVSKYYEKCKGKENLLFVLADETDPSNYRFLFTKRGLKDAEKEVEVSSEEAFCCDLNGCFDYVPKKGEDERIFYNKNTGFKFWRFLINNGQIYDAKNPKEGINIKSFRVYFAEVENP